MNWIDKCCSFVSTIIIPTVYDDALSFLENLQRLAAKVNEIAEKYNDLIFVKSVNGKSGDVELAKLQFTGGSTASYNGSEDVTVNVPVGVRKGELAKLVFTGGANGEYDGSEPLNVVIPDASSAVDSVNGKTGAVTITAKDLNAATPSDVPKTLPNPQKLIFTGGAEGEYDGSKALTVNIPSEIPQSAVTSVNGQTGAVVLTPEDVGAAAKEDIPKTLPNPKKLVFTGASTAEYDGSSSVTVNIPNPTEQAVTSVNGQTGAVNITAADVGALPDTTTALPSPKKLTFTGAVEGSYDGATPQNIEIPISTASVNSVNGKTGVVVLTASDVGALPAGTAALPNPQPLSWSGFRQGSYDGSRPVSFLIPDTGNFVLKSTNNVVTGSNSYSVLLNDGAGIYLVSCDANIGGSVNPVGGGLGWSNIANNTPCFTLVIANASGSFTVNFKTATTQAGAISVYKLELSVSTS